MTSAGFVGNVAVDLWLTDMLLAGHEAAVAVLSGSAFHFSSLYLTAVTELSLSVPQSRLRRVAPD